MNDQKMKISRSKEEEQFLLNYDITAYERPSIAVDIAAFAIYGEEHESHRKDEDARLSLLLVRRGEHPFKGKWALPGGFLRPGETVEECACRETLEETGLSPASLLPIGIFSASGRDPRGWIISNAFASVVCDEEIQVHGGDDAAEARWFDVVFQIEPNGIYRLELRSGSECFAAMLKERRNGLKPVDFEILEDGDLAFDHAGIIASALMILRKKADDPETVFDFLPEKFTLAALQKAQEVLQGISLLTANFRRKMAAYIEETEEYTKGAGHRPARLFKRK